MCHTQRRTRHHQRYNAEHLQKVNKHPFLAKIRKQRLDFNGISVMNVLCYLP